MAEGFTISGVTALYVPAGADKVHSFFVVEPCAASAEAFARQRAAALEGLAEALAPASGLAAGMTAEARLAALTGGGAGRVFLIPFGSYGAKEV